MVSKLSCYLCESDLGDRPEDSWCYGCKKYICEMHDSVFGSHKPDAHDSVEEDDY